MGSEYFINSQELENKVRNLLPSQGGAGAGFDLSASTQIIPIIDLTESAEGSNLRQDLQTSLGFTTCTPFAVLNTTTTLITTTGYFRVFGFMSGSSALAGASDCNFTISDGTSDKILLDGKVSNLETNVGANTSLSYDFVVLIEAGHSLKAISGSAQKALRGTTRQIATLDGTLVNP